MNSNENGAAAPSVKTQLEYWQEIEEMGGILWRVNHEISHGRIEETPELRKDLNEVREKQQRLAEEVRDNFGIILPGDYPKREPGQELPPPPEGKKYYWTWYEEMKREIYSQEYESLICSGCPFSEGLDSFIGLGKIPCGVFRGWINNLRSPLTCAMVSTRDWTEEKLLELVAEKGEDALKKFQEKKEQLSASKK
jgi:hypothetical protein